jgi:Na+-transporting NADH:ubiquinone oxidoreductase subunit F
MQTFKTQLTNKTKLTDDVYLLNFKLLEPTKVEFQPGQYMMLLCPQKDSYALRRMYSIASHPSKFDSFDLIVEIVPNGVASTYVLAMNEGQTVDFQGPAGMFTLRGKNKDNIFLATGTGIAPMISMINQVLSSEHPLQGENVLLWGLPHLKDMYMFEDLKDLSKDYPQFTFSICLSRETSLDSIVEGDKEYFTLGRVTKALEDKYGTTFPSDCNYYLCGSRVVVEALRQYLSEKNVPKEHIIFEKF